MRPGRARRALRTRLLAVNVAAVGLALVVLIAAFNVVVSERLDADADEVVTSRAVAELAALTVEDGRIALPEDPQPASLQARVWIFEGDEALRAPRVGPELHSAARGLAGGPRRTLDDEASNARLIALPVVDGGRRIGTVVAAVSLEPHRRTRLISLATSIALGVVVLAGVGLATAWLLRAALRPVARMTDDAAAWSEGDLDERFGMGPPHDEITRLAATLDELLDRIAAGRRRDRAFAAEVSHELRTPLARIRAEADLALRRPRGGEEYRRALAAIGRDAEHLGEVVETLLATVRQETGATRGTADVGLAAERVVEASRAASGRGDLRAAVAAPGDGEARAGVDPAVAERVLQPVVENAMRFAASHVRVEVEEGPAGVLVTVSDDGPGVPAEDAERIFEPGVRSGSPGPDGGGAGLGLALARRLARSAAGDVTAVPGPAGRFVVRLPPAGGRRAAGP